MKWFKRNQPPADLDREALQEAARETAKASIHIEKLSQTVQAQSVVAEEEKAKLKEKLSNNHFRDKIEVALFGQRLR